ncbi:DNA polymerase III subunit delta [Sphingorhabdus arenilitoris]|uniref:DNA-directed DNA polymerase n=1 Tax=Sphingorhabdus arenilitoris TaxID=1490041 RepID=A0ABV8RIZ9_9SPHN
MSFRSGPKKLSESEFIGAVTARPDIRLFLIFGQDASAISDIAARAAAALGEEAERVDLDGEHIRKDPALLADEASSLSLFGGSRYIRLTMRREEALNAFENLLGADQGGNPVIATAGDLKKTSKLRKLAEGSKQALTYICYPPGEGQAAATISALAQQQGLRMDRALALRIARYTGQDRKLAAMEVEKLALYHDASPDNPVTVDMAAFEQLSAETGEENVQALINHVLGGKLRALGGELLNNRQMGVDAVRIIRAMQRQVALLIGLRAKVEQGTSPGAVVRATPSIFFKEKESVEAQLIRWPAVRLAGLNGHLIDIEQRVMSVKAELGTVILEEELTKIARAAARAG